MNLTDEELNTLLKGRGWYTIEERMAPCPMDKFYAHAGVTSEEKMDEWIEMRHRELTKRKVLHDLGIQVMSPDTEDFILGQLKMMKEFIANLRQVENNEQR
jgi:hypothetical protein